MVLVWCTGNLIPETVYSPDIFFSLLPLLIFIGTTARYHGMIFTHPFAKNHCVSSSLRQEETALGLS